MGIPLTIKSGKDIYQNRESTGVFLRLLKRVKQDRSFTIITDNYTLKGQYIPEPEEITLDIELFNVPLDPEIIKSKTFKILEAIDNEF